MVDPTFIAALRRMVAEPTAVAYTDAVLSDYIEAHALIDHEGHEPTDSDWTPTYDLNFAASDVWEEKAAGVAGSFDFSADGGSYSRSQAHEQCMKMVRHFLARRVITTVRSVSDFSTK